jgi:hypothetical protein
MELSGQFQVPATSLPVLLDMRQPDTAWSLWESHKYLFSIENRPTSGWCFIQMFSLCINYTFRVPICNKYYYKDRTVAIRYFYDILVTELCVLAGNYQHFEGTEGLVYVRNVGECLPDYTVSEPRRWQIKSSPSGNLRSHRRKFV